MDQERFLRAVEAACARQKGIIIDEDGTVRQTGIGTRGEKGVHSTLKHYYEPDVSCHEIPVGGYVADIVGENGIIEIQSVGFHKLRDKLTAFLEAARVTVVWPCVVSKRLIYIDKDTGEVNYARRSPKKASQYGLLCELWGLGDLLLHPDLSIVIAMLEADEYRPSGQSRGRRGRKGANNGIERIPTAFVGELRFDCPDDYRQLIPEGLPERFTMAQFSLAAGFSSLQTSGAVKILLKLGVIAEDGKEGRSRAFVQNHPSAVNLAKE